MSPKDKIITKIRTVMFIDIVGYTKTTTELTREKFNELHDIFDSLSLPIFEKNGGKVIQKVGDAFLASFESATDAVKCGIELQKNFAQYRFNYPSKKPLHIRVAIHSGEVIIRDNDIHGDTVNVTARIEGIAHADDIVLSEAVYQAMNKNEVVVIFIGSHLLKGIKHPIKLFRVKKKNEKIIIPKKRVTPFLSIVLFLLILLIILFTYYFIISPLTMGN